MSAAEAPDMTFDEFLRFEVTATLRHELWGGQPVVVQGKPADAVDLAGNVLRCLDRLREDRSDFRCHTSSMMVYVPQPERGLYPSISALAGEREFVVDETGELHALKNPQLVVQVMTRQTAAVDLGVKADLYAAVPSLSEYVVIDPTTHWVRVHRRVRSGWSISTVAGPDACVLLDSVGAELSMSNLYWDLEPGEHSRVMQSWPVEGLPPVD